jgi:hypothetical protein
VLYHSGTDDNGATFELILPRANAPTT